ncbi:TPA: hypothetical protein U2T46_000884 [Burkholderia cenocepacia]|nr:hypothetical protein [Burkholderia cenocepacia]
MWFPDMARSMQVVLVVTDTLDGIDDKNHEHQDEQSEDSDYRVRHCDAPR